MSTSVMDKIEEIPEPERTRTVEGSKEKSKEEVKSGR